LLQLVDESIEAFLRASVPLDPGEVAISFDAPDKQWSAGISQPTVNIFLYGIARDLDRARSGVEHVTGGGAGATGGRRRPLPRVELSYLITAWTSDHRDEHQLLGELMRTILAVRTLRPPHLRSPLDQTEPLPVLSLAPGGSKATSDIWKAIDGQLKPGLMVNVQMVVDTGLVLPLAPEPEEVSVATSDRHRPGMAPSNRKGVASQVDEGPRRLVTPPRPPVEVEGP
jgi:hypothetical protein